MMMNNIHIAVDLAKNVFQIAESNSVGKVTARKRFNRSEFYQYVVQKNEHATFIMEACGTAHYWGRVAQAAGHRVVLLHPHYVKPYRRRNKTDRNDCDAILNASRAVEIKPVPVKTSLQQQVQQLHRMRELWKQNRTQRINLLRAILREHGFDNAASKERFLRQCAEVIDTPELSALAPQLHILLAEIQHLTEFMATCERQLAALLAHDDIVKRIDDISGIGALSASALVAAIGTPERFKNGRMLSAWLGMTPREFSSGERRSLGSISRAGNTYVRTLLIHCARSALLAATRCAARTPEKLTRLQQWAVQLSVRIGFNKATVALANKMVRIAWAVWKHARQFDGNYVPMTQRHTMNAPMQ
jgi:transposase